MVFDQEKLDLTGVSKIIAQEGGEILGLGTYRETWGEHPVFYLRFCSANAEQLAEPLRTKGYSILGVHP